LTGGIDQLDPNQHRNLRQVSGLNHQPNAVLIIWLGGRRAACREKEQRGCAETEVPREYTPPVRWNRHGHSGNYGRSKREKQPAFSKKAIL
jgi:hypothetical protein